MEADDLRDWSLALSLVRNPAGESRGCGSGASGGHILCGVWLVGLQSCRTGFSGGWWSIVAFTCLGVRVIDGLGYIVVSASALALALALVIGLPVHNSLDRREMSVGEFKKLVDKAEQTEQIERT